MTLADERDSEEEDEEKQSLFEKIQAAFPLLMAWLYRHKDFTYESMTDEEVQSFVRKVSDYFDHAVDTSIRQVPMAEVSVQRLKESNYVFSGIKVFHELNEAFPSMLDDNNELRPFEDFLNDVQKVNNTYNGSYLKTEYNFARQSSLSAARWKQFEKDGDRYNLQYRTAYDDRVRTSHRKLEGITLPPSSKFWNDYFPPNGWNCRCTVVQVRKDKYPESDEQKAIDLGSQATAGRHQEMFKFNPGKAMTTFPAYNAYTIRKCKNCKYNGSLKLVADIPDNEQCAACKVVREMAKSQMQKYYKLNERSLLNQLQGKYEFEDEHFNGSKGVFVRNSITENLRKGALYFAKSDVLRNIDKYLSGDKKYRWDDNVKKDIKPNMDGMHVFITKYEGSETEFLGREMELMFEQFNNGLIKFHFIKFI